MTTFKWASMKKAIYYYYSGLVIVKKVEGRKVRFEVDGTDVIFRKENRYLKLLCSCTFCSLHSTKVEKDIDSSKERITKYQTLCSKKMACLLYLYSKKGTIKEL